MRAGAARVNITPPLGLLMSGMVAEKRRAAGLDTPLYCRALVMENNGVYLAIVSCDLLLLEKEYCNRAFTLAAGETGIPIEAMMLCCSHTHSGPQTSRVFMADISIEAADYLDRLTRLIAGAITEAYHNLTEARIGSIQGSDESGIGENSRYLLRDGTVAWFDYTREEIARATGPVDKEITTWHVIDNENKTIALMYNFSCHACTGNRERYFADFPGVASDLLESILGGTALFLTGACGNIHPVSAWLSEDSHSAEENGRALAHAVLHLLTDITEYRAEELCSLKREMVLPCRQITGHEIEEMEGFFKKRSGGFSMEFIEGTLANYKLGLEALKQNWVPEVRTVLQVMRIGNGVIAGVPGELFVEFGLELKSNSCLKPVAVTELANDWIGYIPTEEAFALGGYQTWTALSSRMAPQVGRLIMHELSSMLDALGGEEVCRQ